MQTELAMRDSPLMKLMVLLLFCLILAVLILPQAFKMDQADIIKTIKLPKNHRLVNTIISDKVLWVLMQDLKTKDYVLSCGSTTYYIKETFEKEPDDKTFNVKLIQPLPKILEKSISSPSLEPIEITGKMRTVPASIVSDSVLPNR